MKIIIRDFILGGLALLAMHSPASCADAPANTNPVRPAASVAPSLAPVFSLPDTQGKVHSLKEYQGRPLALFFFCGCGYCRRCALAWSPLQQSGNLNQLNPSNNTRTPTGAKPTPLTIVVFHGDAPETRAFAETTQLDPKQTVLLLDPEEKITDIYQADPCPRVFVVDGQGHIRYTNNEQGADSYKMPAPLIVARTVDALRSSLTVTNSASKPKDTASASKPLGRTHKPQPTNATRKASAPTAKPKTSHP